MSLRGKWLKTGLAVSVVFSPVLSWGSAEAMAAERPAALSFAPEAAAAKDSGDVVPGKVIVKYKESAQTPGGLTLFSAVEDKGFVVLPTGEHESVASAIDRLKEDPSVAYAEPVYRMHYADVPVYSNANLSSASFSSVNSSVYQPDDPSYVNGSQWGLSVTQMTYAWEHVQNDRSSVTIAIVDSGVNTGHPDLAANVLQGYDFYHRDNVPEDEFDHGTRVAGIAAAVTNNGLGIAGAAGGVKILPVKVGGILNGREDITTDIVAEGIRWAVDHKADVINLSLGGSDYSKVLDDAVQYALNNKVVVVAAAGNHSNHWIRNEPGNMLPNPNDTQRRAVWTDYPAMLEGVISVGAVTRLPDNQLTIADFSSVGKVSVVGPGTKILSTTNSGNSYAEGDGTSFSSPLVAGLAALLKVKDHLLDSKSVERILHDSAQTMKLPGVSGYTGDTPTYEAYYGGGLMDGQKSFAMPRLKLEATRDTGDSRKVVASIKAVDDEGKTIESLKDSVSLRVVNLADKTTVDTAVIDMVYGVGTREYVLNVPDIYALQLQVDDPDGTNKYIRSNPIQYIERPASPQASLSPGSYTGTQTVTLTTGTSGAQIFYIVDSSNDAALYNGPITVSRSLRLTAIAVKNQIASLPVSFDYTITAPPAPVGGGGFSGGFGGGFAPPPVVNNTVDTPVPAADGVLKVAPDKSKLLEQIGAAKGQTVAIDAMSDAAFTRLAVELPGEVWRKAAAEGTTIRIASNQVTFTVPANAFTVNSDSAVVTLTVAVLGSADTDAAGKPAYAALASPVFDFKLQVGDQTVSAFNKSITAELKYDASKVTDPGKIGVYYFNDRAGAWEYVGGKADSGTIRVSLDHFSKYAVMEWNRTFSDITDHWARQQIERMAAKQIANGMTDTAFAPDAQITRAQFAALLARTLKLKADSGALPFTDVPADSWFRDAVSQAFAAKLISGVSDTAFAPDENITREQMAVMLMNAYAYATGTNPDTMLITQQVRFSDQGSISSWAIRPALLASASGLMEGNPDGSFGPRDQATRAQAITVLSRLLEKLQG